MAGLVDDPHPTSTNLREEFVSRISAPERTTSRRRVWQEHLRGWRLGCTRVDLTRNQVGRFFFIERIRFVNRHPIRPFHGVKLVHGWAVDALGVRSSIFR